MSNSTSPSQSSRPSLVIVPPPTPNGSLHVGHLSGPYLYADVYRRASGRLGQASSLPFHTDVHQSYVATAAARKGVQPIDLAASASADIREALQLADIPVSLHGELDAKYVAFIQSFFETLRRKDALVSGTITLPRGDDGTPKSEAWVSGRCPTCLSKTSGGICEVCGHPNAHVDLVGTAGANTVTAPALQLRLEALRPGLEAHFSPLMGGMRPALRALLTRLFDGPLPTIPVTLPGTWGCKANVLSGQHVYNPWLELLPAHICFAGRTQHPWTEREAPILFFGFDNSWFYTVVHAALLLAHGDYALPRHYVTNEFYELGSLKFSTSLGHVVWAKDALKANPVDALRYYVAKTNPAYQRTSFDPAQVTPVVSADLVEPLRALLERRGSMPAEEAGAVPERFDGFFSRIEGLYAPDVMDIRGVALALANGLPAIAETVERRKELDSILLRWASLAGPIMPRTAQALTEFLLSTRSDGGGHAPASVFDALSRAVT